MLREYSIYIFGMPARILVWILIAFFLGLIFSMMQWPAFWRRLFDKKHKASVEARKLSEEERAKLHAERSKKLVIALLWIVGVAILLLAFFYLVGVLV